MKGTGVYYKPRFIEGDRFAYAASGFKGNILIELFGRNIFPRVGELPYLLTMGPYQFYWFRLRRI